MPGAIRVAPNERKNARRVNTMKIKKYFRNYDGGKVNATTYAIGIAIQSNEEVYVPGIEEKLENVRRLAKETTTANDRKIIQWNLEGLEVGVENATETVQRLVCLLKSYVTELY